MLLFEYAVAHRIPRSRPVGLVVLAVLGYLLTSLPALVLVLAADLLLAETLSTDARLRRSGGMPTPVAASNCAADDLRGSHFPFRYCRG